MTSDSLVNLLNELTSHGRYSDIMVLENLKNKGVKFLMGIKITQ